MERKPYLAPFERRVNKCFISLILSSLYSSSRRIKEPIQKGDFWKVFNIKWKSKQADIGIEQGEDLQAYQDRIKSYITSTQTLLI